MGGRRVPECTGLRHPSTPCPMHGETPERCFEADVQMHLGGDEERLQQTLLQDLYDEVHQQEAMAEDAE
eukprot:592288-Alexandrium_andersonii.AAC.1